MFRPGVYHYFADFAGDGCSGPSELKVTWDTANDLVLVNLSFL